MRTIISVDIDVEDLQPMTIKPQMLKIDKHNLQKKIIATIYNNNIIHK